MDTSTITNDINILCPGRCGALEVPRGAGGPRTQVLPAYSFANAIWRSPRDTVDLWCRPRFLHCACSAGRCTLNVTLSINVFQYHIIINIPPRHRYRPRARTAYGDPGRGRCFLCGCFGSSCRRPCPGTPNLRRATPQPPSPGAYYSNHHLLRHPVPEFSQTIISLVTKEKVIGFRVGEFFKIPIHLTCD